MLMAMSKYDEIINLPHHVSNTRPQMPTSDGAVAKEQTEQIGGNET